MTRKLGDQGLDTLERRFQALRDQIGARPEACRPELEGALQELSQAIAALRADREAGESPAADPPGDREAQKGPTAEIYSPMSPEVWPGRGEAMLRHVFNAIPDLLTVHDRDFNTIMSNWHGYESVPEAERRGQPKCYRVYHHRDRPCDNCHALEVLATGQPVRLEKVTPADGRVREVSAYPIRDESGRVVLVVEHVRDITDRQLAEQALKESEGRFRTLIEDSPESLFLTDVQGTILAASRTAARRLGKELAEVIGASAFGHLPPEVASSRRALFEQVIATGRPVRIEDVRGDMHFDINFNPILDADGKVSRLSILAIDITDRKNAEQARKESEARFRAIFATAQDSIFIKDRSFRFSHVNPAMERIFSQPAADLIGVTGKDLFGEDGAVLVRKQDQRVLKGEVIKGVITLPVLGAPTTFHVIKVPLHDDAGEIVGICGIARDITDLKRAEVALRESEELYRSLFENMLNGFAYCKMFFDQNQPQDFIYLDVNRSFEALTGLKDVVGKRVSEVIPGLRESDPELLEIYGRVALTGKPERFETYVEALKMWLSISVYSPAKEYFVVVFDVITARKQAEAALEESEERFRMLFDYAPDAYFLMDLQGNFLDVNRGTEALTGYGREELIGRNFQALPLFDARQNSMVADLFQQAVNGKILGPLELNLNRKDGGKVIIEAKGLPLHRKGENLLLGIVRDITARKQAEEALRESEARFRAVFEYAPVGICMSDLGGQVLQTNQALQALLGYSAGEFRNMNIQEITHPEDLTGNLQLQEELLAGKRQHYSTEKRCLRKDGGIVWAQVMMTLLRDGRGEPRYLLATVVDRTARKQAEAELRESEQRFRDITENAAEWVWEVDPQGKYTYSSPVVEQLLGYTPEEILGKYFYDFFLPEEREELKNAALAAFAAKQPFRDFLNSNLHKDGRTIRLSTSGIPILDEQGNLLGYRGADIDITARKQAEEALRESEQRFRLMAETIQDVFWIATPDIGKMVYVSPGYQQVWGRTSQELYQFPLSFIDAIHPEDRERVKSEITAAREQGIPWSHEYRITQPDGTGRWIQDRGFPVRDDQGRVILFTGVATDITRRKALEQQLLQAQKMEAVGRLAGGVAHDFNNLLMAITGYGELMRAKVLKDDPLYSYLENILKAGDRAAALTQQLLTFSRQKIVHPQVIDLNRVVLDLEPMLRRLIGEDLDLEVVTDRRLGAVKADPGQIGQIIMNLVVNARDAMPQGGRLTLKTAPVNFTVGCHSRFGLTPPGAYVRLEVQDTGVGMDEGTQSHVFEPFFTTKEPGKGTGLGLSTVYGIVKQSGGYLDLASEPGAGSTFTIYLPRLEAIVEPPQVKIPITASFRGEETILLVEDEDVLRGLLAKFLRLYGYTVLEARHGGEALLTCERHPGPIHVMVTDVVMPQMSGRELADRLTPLRPEMKVLYMSGYTEDALVQHGVADLSVSFLQKPFRPIELARRVHAVLHPPVSQ